MVASVATLLILTVGSFSVFAFNIQVPTCPAECICLSQTQVMCNTGGLTEMPLKTIPPTVEYLSLTKNAFAVIKSDAFKGLRNIRKLSLDGNNITMIKPFAFRGLPKLRELSIQHTPLTTISQFSFAGLQNITSILLGHNKIEKIEGYSFAGTSNVRLLLLNNNPVQTVESRAFSGLRNVDHLIFPTGVKNLEADAFSELDYVGILKLAFMDLPYLKPYTFRGLSHVQLLAITDSDLGVIRSNAFEGMTHIGSLNLINNKIDAIQQFHIKKVNHVRMVRFHGNHLLETPRRDAILVQNVETLSVNKNHFPCDCHLHTLLSSPLVNSTVDFRQNNFCISPLEVNGKPISHIDMDSVGRCRDDISRGNLDAFQNDSSGGPRVAFPFPCHVIAAALFIWALWALSPPAHVIPPVLDFAAWAAARSPFDRYVILGGLVLATLPTPLPVRHVIAAGFLLGASSLAGGLVASYS